MSSHYLTAGGAFLGTFLGIIIAESAGAGVGLTSGGTGADIGEVDLAKVVVGKGLGFLGTSVMAADLMLPATAGGESTSMLCLSLKR